ncbi:MAG: response regulator transcription factor [Hyphomicrobiales bacterium]|nr:response regulator transcription factor [Hyphomicrobiales bacterium]
MGAGAEACARALGTLSELVPNAPVIILSSKDDGDLARTAISHGAKGYIPCTMGFELAVAAVRLVLAGGSYAPMDFGAARGQPPRVADVPVGGVTPRELAVVRAIQQGKSNKVIAYELNMCESTVKVHVRNIMKKLSAKNRTEVAMKAQPAVEVRESVAPAPRIDRPQTSASLANSTMRKSSAPHSSAIFSARSSVSASDPAQ